MNAPLSQVLGSISVAVAADYLARYLNTSGVWPVSTVFSREEFSHWLATQTNTEGVYGCKYVLEGLDELVSKGHIKKSNTHLELTTAFIEIMRQHIAQKW